MTSAGVEEGQILVPNTPQMPLAQEHDFAETFFADGSHKALSHSIGVRREKRSVNGLNSYRMKDSIKASREFRIVVVDQEADR
jgi:hypothetical protein